MTDQKIFQLAKEYLPEIKGINTLYELGFLDMYRIKIALIRKMYFDGINNREDYKMQMITNLSIDFSCSESVIKRAVYNFPSINFE